MNLETTVAELCYPPIQIDSVLDDPSLVQRLVETNAPYAPVQRYFTDDAEFQATAGEESRAKPMFIAPVFRGDWAYDKPLIEGVEPLLQHEGFSQAAREIFDADIVRPFSVYSNLTWQLPFSQGPGHIDVPEFRGINRTEYPIWLLTTMNHSRLFEAERIQIATTVAWFYQGSDGGFDYWPNGKDAAPKSHEGHIFNTAVVGDNDRMFHRVRPTGQTDKGLISGLSPDAKLTHRSGSTWTIEDEGRSRAEFDYAELRISISWKAHVFKDVAEERSFVEHENDMSIDEVWRRFSDDLKRRGIAADVPAEPVRDPEWIALLSSTYVEEPSVQPVAA